MDAYVAPAGQSRAFAWELTGGVGSLAEARQQFEQWLAEQAVEAGHAADLIVVLSELAANAIAAIEGDHDEPIAVRAWRAGNGLVLEVENPLDDCVVGIVASPDGDALRGSGRGLLIVAAYTDGVEVIPAGQASGRIVRCHKLVEPLADHPEGLGRNRRDEPADPAAATARLLALAVRGNPRPAIALGLGLLADGATPAEVIVDVLAPAQREVGVRWETNRWSIADEHAATAVVDGVLGALSLETPANDRRRGDVVVACAEGEHHTMPARMGVELLRADGWGVTFLGGSLPADDLQRFAAEREPDAVVISCTVPLSLPGARRCFTAVGALGLPILGAGAAFGTDAVRARRLGAHGWLGPGMKLATVLEDLDREPLAHPTPREAFALELAHEELVALSLSSMADHMPVMATYTPDQLDSTRSDIDHILEFLRAAVDLDDDGIFDAFVAWLSGVRSNRRVPPSVVVGSVQVIGEVLERAGMTQAARLCSSATR